MAQTKYTLNDKKELDDLYDLYLPEYPEKKPEPNQDSNNLIDLGAERGIW